MIGNTTIAALLEIWDELPDLMGAAWPDLEGRLRSHLEQFETAKDEDAQGRISLQIHRLLETEAPAVLARLDALAEELQRVRGVTTRGGVMRHRTAVLDRPARSRSRKDPVTRYTDISCPHRVWVETPRISVVVRLTVGPPEHSAAVEELALEANLPVRVRVESGDFDILNEPEQETAIEPDADSKPIVFDLRPRQVGPARINLDFLQGGNPVGTASVPLEVAVHRVGEEPEARRSQTMQFEPGVQAPELVLYIAEKRLQGQPALEFTLVREGGVSWRTFDPVRLEDDLQKHANRIYEQFTSLTEGYDPTTKQVLGETRALPRKDIERHIRHWGQYLWDALVPTELRRVYAQEREAWRDRSLLILSDEPYFPWELLWPYEAGRWEDEEPWCLRLRLSRWLRRDAQGNGQAGPPARLRIRALACLAPTDSGLPAAQRERDYILSLIAKHKLTDVSPAVPTWSNVLDLLEGGVYNWMHVAAHGNFYTDTPNTDAALWLEGEQPLTPRSITGMQVTGHIEQQRPAFIFNACEVGRQGWALTRIGGWANRLISSGAGLFLGPLWIVSDFPALSFAETLYESLFSGMPLAEAVREGRRAAQREGDPTWLAYSVYGHPNARVSFNDTMHT